MSNHEGKRLSALSEFGVLDTLPEESFDRITQLAATLFDAPMAMITLIDQDRVWFKSKVGSDEDESPRAYAFCDHVISLGPHALLVVGNAAVDPRFADNPNVAGKAGVRFYAGAALTTSEGYNVGTLCIVDLEPREAPSDADIQRLSILARMVVDELELARATRALAEQRRLLRLAEGMSGVGHWRYDLVTQQIDWSAGVYDIHGLNPRTFNPQLDANVSFYHVDDQRSVIQFLDRAKSHQEDFTFKLRLRRADGEQRHVTCSGMCDLDAKGATRAIIGVLQDVTDQVRRFDAVERSEKRYKLLADHMGDVVTRVKLDGSSSYISPAIENLLGYQPEDMRGQPAQAFVHPDDQHLIMATFAQMAQGLPTKTIQHRASHKDGRTVWVETQLKMLRDDKCRPTEIIAVIRDVSARKAAEDKVAESEARYRRLADNASDIVTEADLSGRFTYVSPAAVTVTGYELEELVGKPALDFVHPDDRQRMQAEIEVALKSPSISQIEHRHVRKDGRVIWVESRPAFARDAATGRAFAITDVMRDITARKESEAALEQSQSLYRLLAVTTNDVVLKVGTGDVIQYVSPSIRLYGWDPDEMVGAKSADFIHPDDIPRMNAVFTELAADRPLDHTIDRTYRMRSSDGSYAWMEGNSSAVRHEDGSVEAIISNLRDVTERKAAEAALVQSEQRYRLLADNSSDMITQFKPGGEITFVTPACQVMLGYTPEEMIGTKTSDIAHPDDLQTVIAYYQALIAEGPGGVAKPFQFRARHRDGHWVWMEGQPKIFFDDKTGRNIAMQDVVRDVSKRKGLELELNSARIAAEAATVVKAEFLSNMSHELRTPLTSILGFSSILKEEQDLSEQGRRAIARIVSSGQALMTIVNDILDFSKLEAGQVELDPRTVDPREVLKNALELLEPQAGEKGLTLSFNPAFNLPSCVFMDDTRVRQILLNIVGNAVKFTAEGGVTLTVDYDVDQERLRCEVIDTGDGISADRRDRLFKRFSQVDASTTRAFGGTGLGLAICKGLVEAMGGEIGVTSELGQGSCFWFELPCPASSSTASAGEDLAGDDDDALAGLRVLVADDNPANRELVRVMLTIYGVELTEAQNGEEAVTLANGAPFDVILMDFRMPMLDGPGAARLIREGGGPNDITPILAFTANNEAETMSGGFVDLFDGYVAKPISPTDLLVAIARCSGGALVSNYPGEIAKSAPAPSSLKTMS